jgi:lipid-A-disaccharide synthase
MVAGEASGDLLSSLVIPSFQTRWPHARLQGIGGPRMVSLGFDAWWPQEKLAVRGYVEVLRHYREITYIRKLLCQRLIAHPPDVFVGIDAPDFNLKLSYLLKNQGIPTVQFVCPSVWAWRAERLQVIRKSVDHVLCLFPFEPALLHRHGIAASFVGHPLASTIPLEPNKSAARISLGVPEHQKVIALLPGSRSAEIEHILPSFLKAAVLLEKQYGDALFVLPVAPGQMELINKYTYKFHRPQNLQLLAGQSHVALAAADAAMVASGTATLETALLNVPEIVCYKGNPITLALAKRFVKIKFIALVNLIMDKEVVKELIQEELTTSNLSIELKKILEDPARQAAIKADYAALKHALTTGYKATEVAAGIIQATLNKD